MNEERFWLLVSLKLSGEAQPDELTELEAILQQHPEMGLRTQMLNTIWQKTPAKANGNTDSAFNRHMQRLSNHLSEPALQYESATMMEEQPEDNDGRTFVKRKLFWVTGIAASMLILWFVVFYIPARKESSVPVAEQTASTKRGSKLKTQLPDGTQVWLNADSKITFNDDLQGSVREVHLEGEAFFDVVRDESRPFIIHTSAMDVKVLGTSFNVRSYADEKTTETSLIHGSVEIRLHNDPGTPYILKPNEKLIVANNSATLVGKEEENKKPATQRAMPTFSKIKFQEADSSVVETLWIRDKLAFDGESLEDIARKIERWYDVTVQITDERMKKTEFSAVFDGENLQQVMEALQITGKFKYDINRKEVTIHP